MTTIEISIEVEEPTSSQIARLEAAGHRVFRGSLGWRVIVRAVAISDGSRRALAHVITRQVIGDFGLLTISDPPAMSLRDPDGDIDLRVGSLVLEDARRASDPDPLQRLSRRELRRISRGSLK